MAEEGRRPRVVAREGDHHTDENELDDFNYFAFSASDRLAEVKKKIEEREKVYFDLVMVELQLTDNPEPGECKKGQQVGGQTIPCQCGVCELERVSKLKVSTAHAVRKLRALYGRLQ